MKPLLTSLLLAFLCSCGSPSAVSLSNRHIALEVQLDGGAITQLRRLDSSVNPLSWRGSGGMRGHFLCLDRWGLPNAAEKAAGMPEHGEAHAIRWKLTQADTVSALMWAYLPIAGLSVERTVRLIPDAACFILHETVRNERALTRAINIVQHPSIAPPFLDERTILDSNASRGFAQRSDKPSNNDITHWPNVLHKGKSVDLRHVNEGNEPYLAHFVLPDDAEIGWITAYSPATGLLLGYAWPARDYPWVHPWRWRGDDGVRMARGLEFGTAGLHENLERLAAAPTIRDRPTFIQLKGGESQTRTYAAFLLKAPKGGTGVKSVAIKSDVLHIRLNSGETRKLDIAKSFNINRR